MNSIGAKLRSARQERGLDLATVASRTRISLRYLEAIEADDRTSLPSGFFYRSFVHQYARLVDLDTREIDSEIDLVLSMDAPLPLPGQESAASKNVPPMRLAPRFQRSRVYASAGALLMVVLGCSGIYAWWHKTMSRNNAKAPQQVAQLVENPKPEEKHTSPVPASLANALRPSPAPRPPAQGVEAIPGYRFLLDLIAREETWLSVNSDGRKVFTGLLSPNQSKTVQSKEFAKMTVGNAAGLEIHLNGRSIGTLGGHGQVLVVVFTPDNYQILPPPPRQGD